jgi:hypothetical protein
MATGVKERYKELLLRPEWQKKRLLVLERDNWACLLCEDKETTLHVHHLSYRDGAMPWEYEDDNFKTLCKDCHDIVGKINSERIDVFKIVRVKDTKGGATAWSLIKDKTTGNVFIVVYNQVCGRHVFVGGLDTGTLKSLIELIPVDDVLEK